MTTEEIITNLGEEEWEGFQPEHVLSPGVSGKLWNNIEKNTRSPRPRHSYFGWMAVAASVVLVIGLFRHFILKNPKTGVINVEAVAATKDIFNNSTRTMILTLSDGSIVELLPNSRLSYPVDFNSLKREITLSGEANFSIAKDVGKPFMVYSHSVLTTVLGTRFTVKSYETNNTTVILHEGRVMVKIANPSSRNNKKEYYLTPGDILATDSLSDRVLHIEKDKDDRYLFNNYPLDVVFDQLQIIYNTTIVYDKSKLGNRSFIGKIDKRDSLYHLLQSIALLNNFSLRRQGDSILVY